MLALLSLISCVDTSPGCDSPLGKADLNCDGLDDRDADGDGAVSIELGGDDCDDADPALNPDDEDGDGWSSCEGDCDDTRADRGPRGVTEEICDDVDNDCNGVVDEDDLGRSACQVVDMFDQPDRVRLDLLFVLDDSGSMVDELVQLAESGPELFAWLLGTDTHLGFVVNASDTGGRMHGPTGGDPWLDLDVVTEASALAWIQGAVAVQAAGSHAARGLDVAVMAFELAGDTYNAGFRRDDAPLVVVFFGDRDDESGVYTADEFVLWLEQNQGGPDPSRVHAVVPTATPICLGTPGEAVTYTSLATHTGGLAASICTNDIAAHMDALGSIEHPQHDVVLGLSAVPIPATLVVDVLTTDGRAESLPLEAVGYEPFTNTVAVPQYAWGELDTIEARYLVLP